MKKIAIFASGNGSNFQAMVESVKNGTLPVEIGLLVCDRPDAYAIKRANREGVPTYHFSPKEFSGKREYETRLLAILQEFGIEFIVLAGYMRLIGSTLLEAYEGKIVNIHPSLLPAFPGKDAIGQALAAGVDCTGVTVHYVDAGMDTGKVIAQQAVDILPGDTSETLQEKIQMVEHVLYPAVVKKLLSEKKETIQ